MPVFQHVLPLTLLRLEKITLLQEEVSTEDLLTAILSVKSKPLKNPATLHGTSLPESPILMIA